MQIRNKLTDIVIIILLITQRPCNAFGVAKSLLHFRRLLAEPGQVKVEVADPKVMLLPVAESETRGRSLLDGGDWAIAFCPTCQSPDDVMRDAEKLQFFQAVVPSAFAENFPFNASIRTYFGYLLYRRAVPLAPYTNQERFVLRFESIMYSADIYVNQIKVGSHAGGHIPFEFDISSLLKPYANSFALDVVVNTVLTYDTIPPGVVKTDPATNDTYQDYLFDFFHYCGILRSVWLYWTPKSYIADATVVTSSIDQWRSTAKVSFNVTYVCSADASCTIDSQIYDPNGNPVGPILNGAQQSNVLVSNAIYWTPVDYRKDKSENSNQIYHLAMAVKQNNLIVDVYYLPFGIRVVQVNRSGIFINNQALYCRGVGKHEDWPMMGRAENKQAILHDMRVFRWLGGNCLRTSHYPYSAYFYELADKFGITIISESPGVQIRYVQTFKSPGAQLQHALALTEMYQSLKHHPSIVAWSLANEPLVTAPESRPYFSPLFGLMRGLDPTRPVTFVNGDLALPPHNYMSDLADISCINRYFGWYDQTGQIDKIEEMVYDNIVSFYLAYPDKPIIVTEYGAEAVAGLHGDQDQIFSEEYQTEVLAKTHEAFDALIANQTAPLIGELVWNYCDFTARPRDLTRVNGMNNKGLFTRNRQPKMSAHLVRKRYQMQSLHSSAMRYQYYYGQSIRKH